uniref:(California timema) hypothetical protein n=1 Tax=Timema californicum TaxID=61474 RepID=A0A7R9JJC4_TIMCA|nr:unnamed protein product [Timema californicum]
MRCSLITHIGGHVVYMYGSSCPVWTNTGWLFSLHSRSSSHLAAEQTERAFGDVGTAMRELPVTSWTRMGHSTRLSELEENSRPTSRYHSSVPEHVRQYTLSLPPTIPAGQRLRLIGPGDKLPASKDQEDIILVNNILAGR